MVVLVSSTDLVCNFFFSLSKYDDTPMIILFVNKLIQMTADHLTYMDFILNQTT